MFFFVEYLRFWEDLILQRERCLNNFGKELMSMGRLFKLSRYLPKLIRYSGKESKSIGRLKIFVEYLIFWEDFYLQRKRCRNNFGKEVKSWEDYSNFC